MPRTSRVQKQTGICLIFHRPRNATGATRRNAVFSYIIRMCVLRVCHVPYLGVLPAKPYPVHLLGHPRHVHGLGHPLPDEPVDEGALPDIGEADHRHANAAGVHPPPDSPLVDPGSGLESRLLDLSGSSIHMPSGIVVSGNKPKTRDAT